MSEYVDDLIERGEKRFEAWAFEAEQSDGRFKCCCGRIFDLKDAETVSPDPYAIPICPTCFAEYLKSIHKEIDK